MRKNNYILDANAVLRYLLQDIDEQFERVKMIIISEECVVSLEVIAETIYVLEGLYAVPRNEIVTILKRLCDDVTIMNEDVFLRALEIYDKPPKLDFVDCLLYGYKMARNIEVLTFDQKLEKRLKNLSS